MMFVISLDDVCRDGMKWIALANARLKTMPKYDDYMHFNHALFSTTVENKKRPIKLEVHMRFVMQHTMFVKSLDNVCLDLKS